MARKPAKSESRTIERIAAHYEIEKELANRLRGASREERRHLYASVYDEMYQRVTDHPQLTRKTSPEQSERVIAAHVKFLRPFLADDTTFLEIGPGDCALSFAVAKLVKQVYAVDVSDEITKSATQPANFSCILSDGTSIPVPAGSVNVAFSNQLMEHLHPEDAEDQLRNVFEALAPGGVYICATPNRLSGPHDVSRYFDDVATGFHLKEYTTGELSGLFKEVGFSRIRVFVGARGNFVRFPRIFIWLCEVVLRRLPSAPRRFIARTTVVRVLLGIQLAGIK